MVVVVFRGVACERKRPSHAPPSPHGRCIRSRFRRSVNWGSASRDRRCHDDDGDRRGRGGAPAARRAREKEGGAVERRSTRSASHRPGPLRPVDTARAPGVAYRPAVRDLTGRVASPVWWGRSVARGRRHGEPVESGKSSSADALWRRASSSGSEGQSQRRQRWRRRLENVYNDYTTTTTADLTRSEERRLSEEGGAYI